MSTSKKRVVSKKTKSKTEIEERIKLHRQSIKLGGYDTELYYGMDNIDDLSVFQILINELYWVMDNNDSGNTSKP